jgi:hypothetical protein
MEIITGKKILDSDIVIINKKVLVDWGCEKTIMELDKFAECVGNYLKIKERVLENIKNSNAFKESYHIYKMVVLKANEMGIKWKMKKF